MVPLTMTFAGVGAVRNTRNRSINKSAPEAPRSATKTPISPRCGSERSRGDQGYEFSERSSRGTAQFDQANGAAAVHYDEVDTKRPALIPIEPTAMHRTCGFRSVLCGEVA